MTTKKTRFSISHERASEDRATINPIIDSLVGIEPAELNDDHFEDLSDLSRPAMERLSERWHEIAYPVRLALVQEMVQRFETDIEHHYDRALIAALVDEESDVRLRAFEGLTDTTDSGLLAYLLEHTPGERDPEVRAAGARLLAPFVLESELDRLSDDEKQRVRATVLALATDDPQQSVRLQAMESAGYLAGDQDVTRIIDEAWTSGSYDAQVSALRAMGRQCDPRWLDTVLSQFTSEEPELRFEAARSAGTIGGQRIVPRLIDLTEDDDAEVQMAAIGSLGAIGGDLAVTALRNLEQSESIAISDAAGAALEDALLADSATRPPSSIW